MAGTDQPRRGRHHVPHDPTAHDPPSPFPGTIGDRLARVEQDLMHVSRSVAANRELIEGRLKDLGDKDGRLEAKVDSLKTSVDQVVNKVSIHQLVFIILATIASWAGVSFFKSWFDHLWP